MEQLAAYTWMAQPLIASALPLPAIVCQPSMKSTGVLLSGSGSGSQRSWFGGVGGMAWKSLTMLLFASMANGGCWLAGRMRYSHERRFCARGAVKAVPDNCSAYRPRGACCGEFCPCGKAPDTASVANSLPKPLW